MDPRLQAGLELQLDKQAQQETDIGNTDTAPEIEAPEPILKPGDLEPDIELDTPLSGGVTSEDKEDKQAPVSSGQLMSTMLRGVTRT